MFQNLAKYIGIIRLVISLTPLVIEAVKTIEREFPSKSGREKLGTVRAVLENAFSTMNEFTVTFEEIWPSLEALIRNVVATFNAFGIFQKGDDKPKLPKE